MKKAETPKKIQVQSRPKKIMTPNDKLTRTLFNLPENEFFGMILEGEDNYVTENPNAKGKPKIKTFFLLENVGKIELSRPLDEFDRLVFDVCATAREAGFDGITVDTVWHMITGGTGNNVKVRPAQKAAVFESVRRLMSILITVDFSQACAKMKRYLCAGKRLVSTILPCEYAEGVTVNGQPDCDVIFFLKESVLVAIAKAKSQLLTYDAESLNVPNQNNTPLIATIKSYIVRRVFEVKAHELTPKITFADVFAKCRLVKPNDSKKRDVRKCVNALFEYLKTVGVIRDFELEKIDGIYHAVTFDY